MVGWSLWARALLDQVETTSAREDSKQSILEVPEMERREEYSDRKSSRIALCLEDWVAMVELCCLRRLPMCKSKRDHQRDLELSKK